jgi:polysaccharide chain length determinant protein (PEP-CTERM system associated)
MIPKEGIDYKYLKEAFRRRLWYMALPFFLISLSVLLYCIFAPRLYKAQTVILVEPQRVPGEYVSSTVTIDLQSRLRTITQQIKSRTRLEKIIHDYDLYPDIRESATMTDAVESFREKILVNVRGGLQAFEVSFQGKDPKKVRDVTNTLTNLFIEDNLKLREAQAAGTTMFLDRELQRLQQDLERRETAIREFKEEYMGFLPENMSQNHTMMSHLQKQLDSNNITVQKTKDRKILLETQLNSLRRMEGQFGGMAGRESGLATYRDGESSGQSESADLADLYILLRDLRSRYRDKHPDVIKTEAAIAKLERQRDEERRRRSLENDTAASGMEPGAADSVSGVISLFSGQIQSLSVKVNLIDNEMESLLQERKEIEGEIKIYRKRIEEGPKIEQMLGDLRRGYEETRKNYQSLLDKKFKAKMAENLELAQQGEQFTILDHAQLPDKPSKPQSRILLILGFFLAVSGGLGLAALLEYLDPAFYSPKEVESDLKCPVIVSIPAILTERDRKQLHFKRLASSAALVSMASILLYALYFLWKMDPMALSTGLS